MKAFTGLSQAQFDSLLPVFRDIDQATQQQAYDVGVETGARRRKPGGGSKGQLPTMAAQLLGGLSSYKTSPPFDVLGPQGEMGRSKANENLPKLSPLLDDTLGDVELMPYREWGPPEAWKAALQGGITSSLTPPHVPSIVRKKTPNSVRTPAATKRPLLKTPGMSLPEKLRLLLGRTFSGHQHDYRMFKQAFPPEVDWFTDIPVRVD